MDETPLATLLAALFVAILAPSAAPAQTSDATEPPDRIEAFSLDDQHGRSHRVDGTVAALLISRDMDAGRTIKSALAERGGALLEAGHVVYLADVSGMPSLVRRIFAEPSLRKRPYPMLLDREGVHVAAFPREPGKATLIRLDTLRIVSVEHFGDPASLTAALQRLPGVSAAEPGGDEGGTR